MTRACLAVLALCCAGGSPEVERPAPRAPGSLHAVAQPPAADVAVQPPAAQPPAAQPSSEEPPPAEPPTPAPAEPVQPSGEPAAEPEPDPALERVVGPTPGVPTLSLAAAVRHALAHNFGLLDSADAVTGSRWQEKAAVASFFPRVTPLFQRSDESTVWGVDLAQALPWTGASLSAASRYYTAQASAQTPYSKTSDLRLTLTQPLLRGFGPNATFFELRNARRARVGQERGLALARQRVAVEVARGFYDVIAYRQLLDVARQSLARTEALLRSSTARLEVGMSSKLDVFRAELQAQQAREAMVRSEAALESALERFRGALALAPGDPVEPEAAALPVADTSDLEPLEVLVRRALEARLEVLEARDQVDDARRGASLARQNLLPQIDLNLGVTQLGLGSSFGDAWAAGDRRVQVFLSASYPLQQYSQRATSALASLQVGSRERGVRQRELEIEQEVRQAARELEQIRKSVELQHKAVEVAAQQRRLAVLRYQRGLGSNFDVVDAEASLVAARSALVQLLTTFAVARLDLKRSTGTLDVAAEFAP